MTIAAENCIVETKFIASDVGFLEKINSVVALPKDKTENIKGITKLSLYLLNNICATSQENKNIVIPFNASEIIKSIFNALLNVTDFCSKLFSLLFASRCLFSERLCSIAGSVLTSFLNKHPQPVQITALSGISFPHLLQYIFSLPFYLATATINTIAIQTIEIIIPAFASP